MQFNFVDPIRESPMTIFRNILMNIYHPTPWGQLHRVKAGVGVDYYLINNEI